MMFVSWGAFALVAVVGVTAFGETETLPTREEIDGRLRRLDLTVIAELKAINTPGAVSELARIVYLLGNYDAPKKYPGVWQAAAKALGEMPGACELLGERLSADVRAHRVSRNRPDMDVLGLVRSEEAVRVMGGLLFDDYEYWYDPPPTDTEPAIIANKHKAKVQFYVWLRDFPEITERLGRDTEAWQRWWNERKHDPETIRAIAEGRRPPDVVPPPPAAPAEPEQTPAVPQPPLEPDAPADASAESPPATGLTVLAGVMAGVLVIGFLIRLRRRG